MRTATRRPAQASGPTRTDKPGRSHPWGTSSRAASTARRLDRRGLLGRAHRGQRSIPRAAPPGQPGARADQRPDHVARHVVARLTVVDDHDPAALPSQHRPKMRGAQAGQPTPMLHDDHLADGSDNIRANLRRTPVSAAPTSPTTCSIRNPLTIASRSTARSAAQISSPVMRGHPRIQHHTLITGRLGHLDQDGPRRQPPLNIHACVGEQFITPLSARTQNHPGAPSGRGFSTGRAAKLISA